MHPTFWLPAEDCVRRPRSRSSPYDLWHRERHLEASPGKTVSYEHVAEHLQALFDRYDIQRLVSDRWNMSHLRPWLLKSRL